MAGKVGMAPCGHVGVHIVGQYVSCGKCDRTASPVAITRESTQPLCRLCGSSKVAPYTGMGSDEDGEILWQCSNCGRAYSAPP